MVEPLPRGRNPFDDSGVERGADGIARYVDRPASLVAMLRASVERDAAATAVLEVGGPLRELRRAVGRARRAWLAACARRACSAAIASRSAWPTASTGCSRSSARSCWARSSCRSTRASPRMRSPTSSPTLARVHVRAGCAAARRRAGGGRGPRAGGSRGDLLHERHDRLSEGRDDAPRELPDEQRERVPLHENRARGGPAHLDARVGAAVPRHRLQQPADADARARRTRGAALGAARLRRLLQGGRRARRQPARLGAGDLPRADTPPELPELDVGHVRWVSYGGAPIAESLVHQIKDAFPNARVGNGFGLTETSLADLVPAARGGGRARRLGRVRDAGRRPRARRSRRVDRRRRAARARAERCRRATGTSRRPTPRRSPTAGCTRATSRASTPTACCTSSIAART